MHFEIKKYPVRHSLLKNYIKFFWEIKTENMQLNHKLIPQRNINLRFNLSETPQFISRDGMVDMLENVYFSGLQDQFGNTHLKLSGKVDMLGVCFHSDGFYPFVHNPVSEFKNKLLGANEAGLKAINNIGERLREAPDITARLNILENELLFLLGNNDSNSIFKKLFNTLIQTNNSLLIAEFCQQNNIGKRRLERLYNKYVGVSAMTYCTLNRFHSSLNQLLYTDYSKLSDIAYGNGYFDQMHFIKEFKRFTGNAPKKFIDQRNSILQVGKLT